MISATSYWTDLSDAGEGSRVSGLGFRIVWFWVLGFIGGFRVEGVGLKGL